MFCSGRSRISFQLTKQEIEPMKKLTLKNSINVRSVFNEKETTPDVSE